VAVEAIGSIYLQLLLLYHTYDILSMQNYSEGKHTHGCRGLEEWGGLDNKKQKPMCFGFAVVLYLVLTVKRLHRFIKAKKYSLNWVKL
jgi:hypothetical protein